MEKLALNIPDEVGGLPVLSVNRIDGIEYVLREKGWILIRPSETEPLIRIYAESTDEKALNSILEEGKKLVSTAARE